MLTNIILWIVVLYFASLIVISIICSLWLLLTTTKRLPIPEIADSEYCPFWNEIQYDMGLLSKLHVKKGVSKTPNIDKYKQFIPKTFLDIGSGNGTTSQLILSKIFGEKIHIILSDIHPNIKAWKLLKEQYQNISYISVPTSIENISNTHGRYCISLINSLHHLDDDLVDKLFYISSLRDKPIFIMDAKRLDFTHPLLVPIVFIWFWLFLAIYGRIDEKCLKPVHFLLNSIIEPWIMSVDQMIGSARRYHINTLENIAKKYGYIIIHDSDYLMRYILCFPYSFSIYHE